ncbi:MAG TPA: hypothetical protein VMW80_06555 [Candidatus Dormibacteraeota bacterium]|nr:hypothetical protein [Candidatus Dormibacteraeota bacterium]
MSDPPEDPASLPESQPGLPVLRPARRGSQRRFTLLLSGALVVLILIRLLTTHPLPTPSHESSGGAVAGYLIGLEHSDVGEVRRYLAPAQKSQASAVVKALTSRHDYIAAPGLALVTQGKSRATVAITLEVCSPLPKAKEYDCQPLGHSTLGLPIQLTCAKVEGDWYVTTIFKPD